MSSTFTGVLLLPAMSAFGTSAGVTLADETPVAVIHRRVWTTRAKFEIFDATDTNLLATGTAAGFWGNRFELHGPESEFLLEYRCSGWSGPKNGSALLANGQELTCSGNWSARDFAITDSTGGHVAGLVSSGSSWSFRPDSLAFEVRVPWMTMLQAIGLAQCIRAAVEASRSSAT